MLPAKKLALACISKFTKNMLRLDMVGALGIHGVLLVAASMSNGCPGEMKTQSAKLPSLHETQHDCGLLQHSAHAGSTKNCLSQWCIFSWCQHHHELQQAAHGCTRRRRCTAVQKATTACLAARAVGVAEPVPAATHHAAQQNGAPQSQQNAGRALSARTRRCIDEQLLTVALV